MAIAPLIVAVRTTGAAAMTRTAAQLHRVGSAAQTLQRTWRAHTRTISIVQGAYRSADGLWRNANGTLITQRNHLVQVTTRYGRLVGAINRATGAMGRFGRAASRIGTVGARVGSAVAPFALLAGKVVLVAAAITSLLGITGNLLGALQLTAPTVVAAAAGFATLKMALSGVGDALKAGIDGDAEKLAEALKKLTPSARSAVLTLLDLRKEWKTTQRAVQESFFRGFREDAIAVSRALQPIANKWLPRISGLFAQVRTTLRSVFVESANSGQLDKIMDGVTRGIGGFLGMVPSLTRALLDVAEVAAPVFGDIGQKAQDVAQKFADWIRQAKESGKLKEWLDKAMEALRQLKEIAGNVGEMLKAVFRGANDNGQSLLEKINELTQRMADWLNSSDGQELINTLASILEFIIACRPAFELTASVMKRSLNEISNLWDGLKAIASFVVNYILGAYAWLLEGAAKAFSWIPGLGPKLDAAAAKFRQWRDQANEAINGIKKTVDITVNYRARMIGSHLVNAQHQRSDYGGLGGRAQGGPMRAGVTYRINENGDEFIQLGKSGRAYNHRESAGMFGGGGTAQLVVAPGADGRVATLVKALINDGVLQLKVVNGRVKPA